MRTANPSGRDGLAEHVERIVAEAPPLTREQRDRLAVLLRPTPSRRRADTPE